MLHEEGEEKTLLCESFWPNPTLNPTSFLHSMNSTLVENAQIKLAAVYYLLYLNALIAHYF